ncbi:c-type cytochrome [Pseudoxanthomonas taiwanensis]|jgi:mono/diheme cytochrome c family protein|uniref:Cytochrome c, class I n=2 Tax=Gammaproteobacteria TaxID=1236 RepID=A0A921TGI2_9GAMM|nr:cytochrome c [Pseudoxanthomonas taiwanensis]KAF1689633.1 cytochrome c, class I [Pseudoxanthomonas taiwanensis]
MTRTLFLAAALLALAPQAADAADPKALYNATCIACHGPKAEGAIPGVPNLAKSGRLSRPDAELVTNIMNGYQSKGSPLAMPAKGGNPNLTPADAKALVEYMRSLTGAKAGGK